MQGNPGASDLLVRTRSRWYMLGTVLKITLDLHITCRASVRAVQAWKHITFDASYASFRLIHLHWSVRESSIWNDDSAPSRQHIGGGLVARFWVVAGSQTQCILEYYAIAIYVGEVVISKSNLACDNTSMLAGSVVTADEIAVWCLIQIIASQNWKQHAACHVGCQREAVIWCR